MKCKHLLIGMIVLVPFIQCKNNDSTKCFSKEQDYKTIRYILETLDDVSISTEDKMDVWVDDLVHMAPNHTIITDKNSLVQHIENEKRFGCVDMKHEIIEIHSYDRIVVMHGKVTGFFYPFNQNITNSFKTKNLFVFRRIKDNSLKIWKVIFNMDS
ncbi:hypothetical protein [uncultured Aquimarina sp.]|uniref:hypothetical protein n=1 Tax=uncultured Aquimarina sp. TaxID=575652 RepID=UPI002602712E|nr:hypothetical protein [uncultured Aquimarina sp.]